jgi:hypothetical protein
MASTFATDRAESSPVTGLPAQDAGSEVKARGVPLQAAITRPPGEITTMSTRPPVASGSTSARSDSRLRST